MRHRTLALAAIAAAAALISGCAAPTPEGALIADPYEGVNRDVHSFNKGLDTVLVRPATQAYDTVTPQLFQHMLSNFVDHIRLPVNFINYVLQADADAAAETAGRFTVNTLMGAGGLLDPATEFGLPYEDTDFGLTLASWGADEGVYVVLPFFGPSTSRDAVGVAGNMAINPVTYVTFGDGAAQAAAATGQVVAPVIVFRDENFELIDETLYESADSYVRLRTLYVLNRRSRVSQGEVDVESLPNIFQDE